MRTTEEEDAAVEGFYKVLRQAPPKKTDRTNKLAQAQDQNLNTETFGKPGVDVQALAGSESCITNIICRLHKHQQPTSRRRCSNFGHQWSVFAILTTFKVIPGHPCCSFRGEPEGSERGLRRGTRRLAAAAADGAAVLLEPNQRAAVPCFRGNRRTTV